MKRFLLWIFTICFGVMLLAFLPLVIGGVYMGLASYYTESVSGVPNVVAVIELKDIIMDVRDVVNELHRQAADPNVEGIVLRIDSPGGAVGPSQELYTTVKKLKEKKPIIVSMGAIAASGGLYAALPATKIFAHKGTLTGSIGVIMEVPNFSSLAEKVGVQMVTIKSGKLKDVGNSFRTMTDAEREYLEALTSQSHEDFIKAVAKSRNLKVDDVRKFADGRVILGAQALELGLVDDIGGVWDAARQVFVELGEPLAEYENPKLVYPMDRFDYVRRFVESAASSFPLSAVKGMQLKYELQ